MSRTLKWASWIVWISLLVSNLPLVSLIIDEKAHQQYRYSNGDGYFTQQYGAGFTWQSSPNFKFLYTVELDTVIKGWHNIDRNRLGSRLRKDYPGADTIMYRTFWKNPLLFWHWAQYIFNDKKYDFPYKSWEEIKKCRPQNFVLNQQWQMF